MATNGHFIELVVIAIIGHILLHVANKFLMILSVVSVLAFEIDSDHVESRVLDKQEPEGILEHAAITNHPTKAASRRILNARLYKPDLSRKVD